MYLFIYVNTHVFMWGCCVCRGIDKYVCEYVNVSVYVCVYIYIYICLCVCVCVYRNKGV